MPRTLDPLEIDGQPLYKALRLDDKDSAVQGREIVTVDPAQSTDAQPYIRVVEKRDRPIIMIGASEGLLDTTRWRLVPLTGRNKDEREVYDLLSRRARERAERQRDRLDKFRARQQEIDRDGPAIVRSPGIPIAGTPYAAGGGYQGRTNDLDQTVQQAAEMLLEAFGQDVTIRFNSDRKSGGAWVVTDAVDDLGTNAEIGLGAGLIDVQERRESGKRFLDDADNEREIRELLIADGQDPDNPPERYLKLDIKIGERALLHPDAATHKDHRTGYPVVSKAVGTLEEGIAFLKAHARDPREIEPRA